MVYLLTFTEIYLRLWMQVDANNKLYIIGVCVLTVVAVGIVGCGLGYVFVHL